MNPLTAGQLDRYKRQISLDEIGAAGQRKICDARVLIVGAGGLGSAVALYLAAGGVGAIDIADGDTVDLSNLQRQVIHHHRDIGRKKVASAAEKIIAINPSATVRAIDSFLDAPALLGLLSGCDCVIEATDNLPSKFLVNDSCVKAGVPFVHAGIHRFGGEIMTVIPPATACYRCVYDHPQPPPPGYTPVGPLGPVAGVLGTLQAVECLKLLAGTSGLLTNRMLVADMLDMSFRVLSVRKREGCGACGSGVKGPQCPRTDMSP